jgi:leucyl aminopeptidase
MEAIKFAVTPLLKAQKGQTVTVLGVVGKGKDLEVAGFDTFSGSQLQLLGASAKSESIVRTLGQDGQAYLLLGIGQENPSTDEWRDLGGALGRNLGSIANLILQLPVSDIPGAEALLEGIALGYYSYDKPGKSERDSKASSVKVTLVSHLAVSKTALTRISVLAKAVHGARKLATLPANELYPGKFAELAEAAAKAAELEIAIWDEKKLAKDGFGLIAAVGMGSARPPRLVKLRYKPKKAQAHLALVGKGITFDTGGLAVKPLGGMLGMKYDMTGAAVVFEAVRAIAELGLPIEVSGYLCLAENMPSGTSMRPGDVFTARNGKTVEVTNPDAEGRLVLADGLSAASEEKPDLIVDVATLTGAARVALGVRYAGLMGSEVGIAAVQAAAHASGEPVWPIPLAKELRANLDSSVADLQNAKVGSTAGGMIVGGHFIAEFIGEKADGEKLEWAHLDIAGPADNDGAAYGFTSKGPTGVMVRTLVALAEEMSAG